MKTLTALLMSAAMAGTLALPAFARMEGYGPQRFTRVGRGGRRGREGWGRRGVVIDRRRGPGWGGGPAWGAALAGGLIGAAAGLALGNTVAPPVVYGPPAMGTVVPALPYGCVEQPTYYGGGVMYNCGGIYYQPFYQGTSLMFEVVPAP